MIDLTSALYLGMTHASRSLRSWRTLTTGRPAVLGEPAGAAAVAGNLARLVGAESALLAPSTLHLFWDLFGLLDPRCFAVFIDRGAYAVARWGAERGAGRGMPVETFDHHDPASLAAALERSGKARRPVVVTDGICPACGMTAPLDRYRDLARGREGLLIVDDTQGIGILGSRPRDGSPWGSGGGGSLRWRGVDAGGVILIASLAKGFGAPMALIAGSGKLIERFEKTSQTRVHSSPVSAAAVAATERALEINREKGDALRRELVLRIRRVRRGLADCGLPAGPGLFPVQTLAPVPWCDPAELNERLLERGVQTLLYRPHDDRGPRLGLIVTLAQSADELDGAIEAIGSVRSRPRRSARRSTKTFNQSPGYLP